jgi:hypothetical protein
MKVAPRDPLDEEPLDEDPLGEVAAVRELRRDAAVPELRRDAAVRPPVGFFAAELALRPDVLLALLRAVVTALREPPLPLRALLFAEVRLVCLEDLLVVATRSPFPGLLRALPAVGGR